MRLYTFNSRRKKPILGNAEHSLEVNRKLQSAFVNNPACIHLAKPIVTEANLSGEEVSFVLPEYNGVELLEAADLREQNPQLLRKLRYEYRDWQLAVSEAIRTYDLISDLGLDPEQLISYLSPENAVLWAAEDVNANFHWKCCLGFLFEKHSDNFLPLEAGPYQEKASYAVDPSPHLPPDSHRGENEPRPSLSSAGHKTMSNATPIASDGAALVRPIWWKGIEPQITLIFSTGFLLAAILSSIYFRLAPCDTTVVEQQIDALENQVEQRCRFSDDPDQ
jgi:hypothetical protein